MGDVEIIHIFDKLQDIISTWFIEGTAKENSTGREIKFCIINGQYRVVGLDNKVAGAVAIGIWDEERNLYTALKEVAGKHLPPPFHSAMCKTDNHGGLKEISSMINKSMKDFWSKKDYLLSNKKNPAIYEIMDLYIKVFEKNLTP